MNAHALWWLLRPSRRAMADFTIPAVASVVVTFASFTAVTIALRLWRMTDRYDGYAVLAVAIAAILLVPVVTVGGSSARLMARQREDRLALLRLLGLSAVRTRLLLLMEVVAQTGVGLVVGWCAYAAIAPAVQLLPLGQQQEQTAPWLPWAVTSLIGVSLVGISAVSAWVRLNRAVISPLGVHARHSAPHVGAVRAVIAVAAVVVCLVMLQFMSVSWGTVGITAVIVIVVTILMAVWGVVGPLIIRMRANQILRADYLPSQLIAARALLEDPATAWRQVSPVALTSFIIVPAASLLGFLDAVARGPNQLAVEQITFFNDIRWVVLVVTLLSFLLVGCSSVISQFAAVVERRDLYRSLSYLGSPIGVLQRAHGTQIRSPLTVAVVGPATLAAVTLFPIVAISTVMAPAFAAAMIACLAAGVGIVQLSTAITIRSIERATRAR